MEKSMTLIEGLKNEYDDLKNGVCHPRSHVRASELYVCYKVMNPSSRVTKDNFFICYLWELLDAVFKKDGDKILHMKFKNYVWKCEIIRKIFKEITGKKIKKIIRRQRSEPDQSLIYKVWRRHPHLIEDSIKALMNWLEEDIMSSGLRIIRPSILRRRKRDLAWTKLKFKVLKFIREKKNTSLREVTNQFKKVDNKRTKEKDFLYDLWDLERYGKIQFDPESKKIQAL
jgi:hypothetical protein